MWYQPELPPGYVVLIQDRLVWPGVQGSYRTSTKSNHMGYRVWRFSRGFRGWIGLQSITHSFGGLAGAVILAMSCRLEPTWILAGMIGWTCHLVLDALSGGIPLWWPFAQDQEYRSTLANWKMFGLLDYTHMLVGLVSLMAAFADQQWLQVRIDLLKDDNVRT